MIRRIFPKKDCFITNYKVRDREMTGSNTGASEVLYLLKMAKSPQSGSRAHVLVQFDKAQLPVVSGSASYILHLSDCQHAETLPYDYTACVYPIGQQWTEGRGHDLDYYSDLGNANWLTASNGVPWNIPGAYPWITGSIPSASFHFDDGGEDLEVDVSEIITGSVLSPFNGDYGFLVTLDPTLEADSEDYYIKMFHGRRTTFEGKRPYLEMRSTDWTGSYDYEGEYDPSGQVVTSIYNLKTAYDNTEEVRLRVEVRRKDWNPSIVLTGTVAGSPAVLTEAYYRVVDDHNDTVAIDFGTGSLQHTRLSWDAEGNYFDLDMDSLDEGVVYRIDLLYRSSGTLTFIHGIDNKFRIF
jgi:hypothetical protein